MKKSLVTAVVLGFCTVPLRADIRVTSSTTVSGRAAVLMPKEGEPKITIWIKGMKARTDIETYGEIDTKLFDLEARQLFLLRARSTVAQVIAPRSAPGDPAWLDIPLKLTGKTRMIDGVSCDEHAFATSIDMASVPNPHIRPEAMKGVSMRMNGSVWIAKSAPGAAEWTAFHKAALNTGLLEIGDTGSDPWMNKLFELSVTVGIPYLIEMSTRFEGSGPGMDIVGGMGTTKMVQRVTVSTDQIAPDRFTLPAGYTLDKR